MSITNLAIQKRRWNELIQISIDSKTDKILEIKPENSRTYNFFYMVAEKITNETLGKLERNHFEIRLIHSYNNKIILHLFKSAPEKLNIKDAYLERFAEAIEKITLELKWEERTQ
jgi:hypothetical protein